MRKINNYKGALKYLSLVAANKKLYSKKVFLIIKTNLGSKTQISDITLYYNKIMIKLNGITQQIKFKNRKIQN